MQNKILTVLAAVAFCAASCMEMGDPYPAGSLNLLSITAVYPEGESPREGAAVSVVEVSGGAAYSLSTDKDGKAWLHLTNGLYRIVLHDRNGEKIFNATLDKVKVADQDVSVSMQMEMSRAGSVVIKEIYSGGCLKLPQEGNYQSDSYILLHNNDDQVRYLDGLCMGTLSPYNSTGTNPWRNDGALPSFLPVIQAVLMIPGNGNRFPLAPGEDAIVCLRGAIDHTAEYPLSVNLNRADCFVCYDPVLFPNPTFHPAPGPLVSSERYLEIVIKTGQANAYTLSLNSPTFVLFRPEEGVSIRDYVLDSSHIIQTPGSSERVTAIPLDWVIDGVEVFNGASSDNQKRLPASIDAGAVFLSKTFQGRSLMRKKDEDRSAASGFEILQDTNNSSEDFYERETQSLHE